MFLLHFKLQENNFRERGIGEVLKYISFIPEQFSFLFFHLESVDCLINKEKQP